MCVCWFTILKSDKHLMSLLMAIVEIQICNEMYSGNPTNHFLFE